MFSEESLEPLRRWVEAMEHSSYGRVTLINLLYDIEYKRLPERVVCQFLQEISEHWLRWEYELGDEKAQLEENAPVLFNKLLRLKDNQDAPYCCQGTNEPEVTNCSRVMMWDDLIKYNLNLSDIPGYKIGDSSQNPEVTMKILERWKKGEIAAMDKMKTRRPFAWVTKTNDLEEVKEKVSVSSYASVLRNRLGLLNFKNGSLVEVKYPQPEDIGLQLKAPTVFDSACARDSVYQSTSTEDGWGATIPLKNGEEGLPEAIHPAVGFRKNFELENLGELEVLEDHINEELNLSDYRTSDFCSSTEFLERWFRNTCSDCRREE